jgi:hypothetical protein
MKNRLRRPVFRSFLFILFETSSEVLDPLHQPVKWRPKQKGKEYDQQEKFLPPNCNDRPAGKDTQQEHNRA